MPVGSPSKQTIASKKYQDKVGYMAKTYKIKKDVVEAFAKKCEDVGVSQSAQLTKMMIDFINNN